MTDKQPLPEDKKWILVGHSHQIADTGDYDGCYEITNGKVSVFTKDDADDDFSVLIEALNTYEGVKFYLDDSHQFLAQHFEKEYLETQSRLDAALKEIAELKERKRESVNAAIIACGDLCEALTKAGTCKIAALQSEVERLQGERDHWKKLYEKSINAQPS